VRLLEDRAQIYFFLSEFPFIYALKERSKLEYFKIILYFPHK